MPQTLAFLRGQVAYMKSKGYDVAAVSSPGQALEAFGRTEGIGERCFQVQRLPLAHRIEVGGELGQQAAAEAAGGAARLVAGLVLVEAQVGIAAGLADVEAPGVSGPGIGQGHDVDRVSRARAVAGGRL